MDNAENCALVSRTHEMSNEYHMTVTWLSRFLLHIHVTLCWIFFIWATHLFSLNVLFKFSQLFLVPFRMSQRERRVRWRV